MKGYVNNLYDIDSVKIPAEMLHINIDEQRLENEFQLISLRYAEETSSESVQKGDLVYCKADKCSYPDGRTILIFTGTDMPGMEEASNIVLGKKTGEHFTTSIFEKNIELDIERILRRIPAEINDELIRKIGIDGVSTPCEYKNYLKEKALSNLRTERIKDINRYVLDEVVANSTYTYNEADMEEYIQDFQKKYSTELEAMGFSGGIEDIKKLAVSQIKQDWVAQAFCKEHNIKVDIEAANEEADQMIEMMSLMGEEIPDREELVNEAIQGSYYNELFSYIENIAKKKLEDSYGNC